MELQFYHTVLVLAAAVNFLIAVVLVHNNVDYHNYDVYRRARLLTALCYTIFAAGFLMHAHFEWRTSWPAAASALSVSYFHAAAVLFGWSHTSLLRPDYLTQKVIFRDLAFFLVGIICYWTAVVNFSLFVFHFSLLIFFLHAAYIAATFYHTSFQVRHSLEQRSTDDNAPSWWTDEAKHTILDFHRSFMVGAHLIILFGIGGIIVTAAFTKQVWPFTALLIMGIAVFIYIFYSLTEYGHVIEAATNATEDAVEKINIDT